MLVLSRKPGQRIVVNGNIEIEVTAVAGRTVRIGITAPRDVSIVRAELREQDRSAGRAAILPLPAPAAIDAARCCT